MSDRIKISLTELKKALTWIEANTSEIDANIVIDGQKLFIHAMDRSHREIEITIWHSDLQNLPKIRKTDIL